MALIYDFFLCTIEHNVIVITQMRESDQLAKHNFKNHSTEQVPNALTKRNWKVKGAEKNQCLPLCNWYNQSKCIVGAQNSCMWSTNTCSWPSCKTDPTPQLLCYPR
jgi:hypothetical protein